MQHNARVTVLSITITFVIALVFYLFAYSWMTKRQTGRGPWQVTFTNSFGTPALVINQPALGITNVLIRFTGESLAPTQQLDTVAFTKPQMRTPFGEVIYDDLMFLPGTVTLDCFGHEVEMIPRHLVLNRRPVPWTSNTTNDLAAAAKLPPEQRKQVKGGYRK